MTQRTEKTVKPWWMRDDYVEADPVPAAFTSLAGPRGLALVRAWPDGRTDQGWGLKGPPNEPTVGFMPRYNRGEFDPRRVLFGYNKGRWEFAFVMRSVRLVCIDIDGKNGGLEEAKKLGLLPLTLAEISKSGNGYHLFYTVADDWSPELGYARLNDRIGIEQGVDIRGTGCVYHHPQQRWNTRMPTRLPKHLLEILQQRQLQQSATSSRITKVLEGGDDMEILLMHDQLKQDLAQPMPPGKRNNTLFAIATQMQEAQVEDWDALVHARAIDVGLDATEIDKLISNVVKYGAIP